MDVDLGKYEQTMTQPESAIVERVLAKVHHLLPSLTAKAAKSVRVDRFNYSDMLSVTFDLGDGNSLSITLDTKKEAVK